MFRSKTTSLWCALHAALVDINRHIKTEARSEFRERLRNRYFKQIIGKKTVDPELGPNNLSDSSTEHRTIARGKRASGFGGGLLDFDPFDIEMETTITEAENIPIVFEENFIRIDEQTHEQIKKIATKQMEKAEEEERMSLGLLDETSDSIQRSIKDPWSTRISHEPLTPSSILSTSVPITQQKPKGFTKLHGRFVFLSHGFQGSKHDCLKLKHFFALQRPDLYFHIVQCNGQEKTTQKIEILGEAFANEVRTVLLDFSRREGIQSISFIGHSQGGLIIRAALKHLREEFGKHFQALVTLSTPHLGVASGDSFLVGAGFNIMTSWKKFDSLLQMGMKDSENRFQC